jgi:hypothetical protein
MRCYFGLKTVIQYRVIPHLLDPLKYSSFCECLLEHKESPPLCMYVMCKIPKMQSDYIYSKRNNQLIFVMVAQCVFYKVRYKLNS